MFLYLDDSTQALLTFKKHSSRLSAYLSHDWADQIVQLIVLNDKSSSCNQFRSSQMTIHIHTQESMCLPRKPWLTKLHAKDTS